MKLHVDLETLRLIEGPGFRNPVDAIRFKRGDGATLEVVFLANGQTPVHLGEAVALKFGVKPRSRYDLGYIVFTADWTIPDAEDANPVYQCSPSFNTEELNSALNVGSPTASELAEIILMGEISWTVGDGEPTSTRTFQVIVENDVNRGTEGVPVAADPPYPSPLTIALLNQVVRFDAAQTLTPEQRQQAKSNMGMGSYPEGISEDIASFLSSGNKSDARAALEISEGGPAFHYVDSNYDKLAISEAAINKGDFAVIQDEGNRIELFIGGSPSSEGAWVVVENTAFVNVYNNSSYSVWFKGTEISASSSLSVGWTTLRDIGFSVQDGNAVYAYFQASDASYAQITINPYSYGLTVPFNLSRAKSLAIVIQNPGW